MRADHQREARLDLIGRDLFEEPRDEVTGVVDQHVDSAEALHDATETVAIMRHTAGADPRDRRLSELVGELSMRSEEFRTRWASHDVRFHNTGTQRFMHPLVGELTLTFERFDIAAESELTMFTYTAEPGTRSAEGLDLLASWAATPHAPPTNRSHLEPIDK